MCKDRKLEKLADITLFAGADRKQLGRIAGCCTEVRLPRGQVICRQGRLAREFIIVEEGQASLQVDDRSVYELAPGDCFGDLALLTGQENDATVTASTAMTVLTLTCAELCSVLDAAPFVAARMLKTRAVTGRQSHAVPDQRGPHAAVPHQTSRAGG